MIPSWVWPIFVSALVAVFAKFFYDLLQNLVERVHLLEISKERTETQIAPLWAMVQASLSRDIHHDNPEDVTYTMIIRKTLNQIN